MKLAQFIQTEMEQLLEDWEEAVLEIAPELKGKDSRDLRDHAREMLEFIVRDLGTLQTKAESATKALGKGKAPASGIGGTHGTDRLNQGMSILQMVQELRALRARVTKAWSDEQRGLAGKDIDELVRFNEAVDQLIATSMASFSASKDQETRLIDTMLKVAVDPKGKLLFFNSALADLVGASPREILGRTPRQMGVAFARQLHEGISTTVATGRASRTDFHIRSRSGQNLSYDCHLLPVFDDRHEVESVVTVARDITERKQTEHKVWQSAHFDLLTGLPNRRLFIDRIEQTLLEAERKNSTFALLFVDLDRFKQANDQIGHEAGDRLLAQVAERFTSKVRAMDTVARLGGDEFTLILKEIDRKGAEATARELLTVLERTFEVDSHKVHMSGSIGLTLFPEHGKDVDQLMCHADQAMYAAKENGGQQVQVYESSMKQSESEHMRLNRELDEGLRENQLEVYYQPIMDIRTGTISRAEALLRWNHPDKGLLTPDSFLIIAEQSGMTDTITAFVLEQAVFCSRQWCDLNDEPFPININESPASFVTRSLVDHWRLRMTEVDFSKSKITLELTPGSLSNIHASGFNPLTSLGLTGLGRQLAIDDFGIEPFSLMALLEFRMDSVKINKELIMEAGMGGDADRILEGIIAMAHAMKVQVVGVGVETDEQLQFLARTGCDFAQGFLFSGPLRQQDFEALLRRDRQKRPS